MNATRRRLTHLDRDGRPAMVDISAKPVTVREAEAECRVRFPADVAAQLRDAGLKSAKGSIVDTAIIAGTMAVKRTHELIPFCHPLPIDGCRIAIEWHGDREVRIACAVRTTHRTGVEMEALTGSTVAALTVYDMCKALSHRIVLGPARLLAKRGGRREVGNEVHAEERGDGVPASGKRPSSARGSEARGSNKRPTGKTRRGAA